MGALYTIGPPRTVFAEPVRLTLPFDRNLLPGGATVAEVVVFTRQDATQPGVDLGGVADGGLVRAELSHLSAFVSGTGFQCTATCGDDGCGGSCGSCDPLAECADGACVPRPARTPPTVWIEVPQDGSALGSDWLVTLVGHAEPTDGDPILTVTPF